MSKPIAIIFNDAHIKTGNESDVATSVNHLINYAIEHKITDVIFAGDMFDNRTFQRQEVLKTFDDLLKVFALSKIRLYIFPGNHDKTTYKDEYSFLDVFRYHPGVYFTRTTKIIEIKGVSITLMPFFSDDVLVPMLEEAEGTDILISHFEMNGSVNLGHVSDKKSITRRTLKKWKKVYLGHFHNLNEITKDIVHLPSLRQSNFGEDSNKGFTVLKDDLSYEIIKGRFVEFTKIVINVDEQDSKDIGALIKIHSNSIDSIRFEFIGEESKLKALDKTQFKGTGIDVKIKYAKKIDLEHLILPEVIEKYDEESVREIFKVFCNDKGYDYPVGLGLLEEFLKEK